MVHLFNDRRHSFIDHIHWNLFDQVLVSEPICDCVNPKDIAILTEYTNATNGAHHKLADDSFMNSYKTYLSPIYSDHLPISFIIDETKLK